MASAHILKQQLLRKIEQLPEDKLAEVVAFAQFLATRRVTQYPSVQESAITSRHGHDPLTTFIGGVSHDALADQVDEELYGS